MRASLPARLLAAALAALIVVPVVPAAPVAAAEPTTVTVASSDSSSTYGKSVTFTATVAPAAAAGSVTFAVDTIQIGDPVPVVDGEAASIAIASLGVGTHTVTAAFDSADPETYASSSGTLHGDQLVVPVTLTVQPDAQSVTYGSPVPTYPFAVTGFIDGESADTATGYTDPTCDSAYTPTTPAASSPLTITCSGGTATNYTFAYGTANLTITKASQSISFTSTAPAGATVGGPTYTPTATATSGLAVAFTIDPVSASVCSLGGGQVSFTGTGTCTIRANQAGDGNWNPATQAEQWFGVGQATTTTAIESSKNPSTYGESVTFTATVTPATATGTVTISDGATTLGTCTLSAGSCAVSTATVRAGTRSIVAAYAGDPNHVGSASSPLAQVVSPRALTVTGITASNKIYDGTTAATLTTTGAALVGVIGGDAVTLTTAGATGTFANKHVGTGKTVTVAGLALGGADAGNYVVTPPTTTASITARLMTVTATGVDKIYDKTTSATVLLSSTQLVAGDDVALTYTAATFSPNGNVGTNKSISVTGIAKSGPDAGNYTLANTTATTMASILRRPLVMSVTATNRPYDGTTAAAATGTLDDVIPGDRVNPQVGAANFADKSAGTAKIVTATGLTIGGPESNQYTLTNTVATDTADITPRTLIVTATGINRVYDGTTAATVTLADNRLGSDVLTVTYASASFATAAVGTAKPVSVTGIAITDGADAGNYTLGSTTAATTASITTATVTPNVTASDKIYDGTTSATATCSLVGVAAADSGNVTCAGTATFATKVVGTAKTVTVSGITLAGTAAGNYALSTTTAQTTASITQRPLTITATGIPRAYDGTVIASVTLTDNRAAGDSLTLGYASASFADKNVGTAKPVSVTGITVTGIDAANYSHSTTAAATADITKRPLTVTATGANKVYDGTTAATVTLGDNRVTDDALTVGHGSALFASPGAADGKTISVTGITVTGADAGNYTWNTTATTTANITKKPVAPSVTAPDKVYDSTTAVPGAGCSLTGVLASDTVTCAGTAAFADKNVGPDKTVTLSAITLSGTAAGNYAVSPATAATTASITQRALTVTATGVNKTYDGTTVAAVTLATNKLGTDVVNATYTSAAFLDKAVGTGKFVGVAGIGLSGADAANYALQNTTEETFANITRRTLTVTAAASNKTYDGTTVASVTVADDRVDGDVLTVAFTSAAFGTKHAGTNKPVTVSGLSIAGADAGNYQLAATATATTANITPRLITVTAVTASKVYDGTTGSSGMPTITSGSLAIGDTVTWTQTFDTKNVGTAKTLTPAGTVADGNTGANYQVTLTPVTTGVIAQKPLTVTGITAASRVYDGTTTAMLTTAGAALVGRVTGDTTTTLVLAGAAGTFADKSVGAAKVVQVAGLALGGGDAGNYALTQPTTTASITKATATVTPVPASRAYGAANPAIAYTFAGLVAGETLATSGITGEATCTSTATPTSGVGPYPMTCVTSATNPLAAANYQFAFASGTLTVAPAPLTVTASSRAREYGLPNPSLTAAVSGFVNGEDAASAQLTGVAACAAAATEASNVGSYAITCARGTLEAPNYDFPPPKFVDGTLLVTQALAAPAVTSSANPAVASQDVTFTATVSWPIGTPTGTVTFFEGATDLSGPLDLVGGAATFTTSWPEAGEEDLHPITAVYSGDGANFGQAGATPFNQVVGKSAVEVLLTASATKWEANVPLTLTADVHPVASGVTVEVQGTVAFRVDGALKATVTVVDGKALYTTKLALGTRTVTASFTPAPAVASIFKAGASAPLAKTVVANTVSASGVGLSSTSIYPVTDTWRDTVAIRGTRNEPLAVTITIYSPTGSKVRSRSYTRAAGAYSYTWNGRNSSGTILAAGKYKVVQVLSDGWGARRTYTSYVTLSRKRMYWYTKTLTVKAGPRNYQVRSTSNTDPAKGPSLSAPSTTGTGALYMEQRSGDLAWIAAGYQFTLPSASTYTSLSFQVAGSWTGTTAPKFGLVPWSGGDWYKAMYSTTRDRATMDTIATDWDPHTPTSLSGIRSGRYVRAVIDSFAGPSGWSAGPYRYSITAVRLVVKYGILK